MELTVRTENLRHGQHGAPSSRLYIHFVAKFQHDYTLDILQAELSISVLKSARKKAGSHILNF